MSARSVEKTVETLKERVTYRDPTVLKSDSVQNATSAPRSDVNIDEWVSESSSEWVIE